MAMAFNCKGLSANVMPQWAQCPLIPVAAVIAVPPLDRDGLKQILTHPGAQRRYTDKSGPEPRYTKPKSYTLALHTKRPDQWLQLDHPHRQLPAGRLCLMGALSRMLASSIDLGNVLVDIVGNGSLLPPF